MAQRASRQVLVVAHHDRPAVRDLVASMREWLEPRGHRMWMPVEDASAHGLTALGADRPAAEADLLVCLGGDGTILRAVHLLDGASVPILAVHVGTLGYLAEVEPSGTVEAMGAWLESPASSGFRLDERMMLRVSVSRRDGGAPIQWRALNEAVLERQQSGHTIWVDVAIDGAQFARYSADGLIVATPTGSTAYNMSARGPVLSPRQRAIVLTPVSPHMLFDRSLVLDEAEGLSLALVGTRAADLVIDGRRVATLEPGDAVACDRAPSRACFLRRGTPEFHQIVRMKFGLGDE
ncbi:MAG: NAD(+)/NADH kinase [Acidimicrobiia bacterium]